MPSTVQRVAVLSFLFVGLVAHLPAQVDTSAPAGAMAAVASTPPLGWNSWDSYGLTITEAQFRDNVAVLRDKLKPYGWQYAVVDEGWFLVNPQDRPTPKKLVYALDQNGRYVPVPSRFPSALPAHTTDRVQGDTGSDTLAVTEPTSFAPMGAWVHAQGLKFGIHIVRGIPRATVERNLPIAGSTFRAADAADTADTCPWDPTNYGVRDNAAGQAWYDALVQQYAGWGVDFLKVDCIANNPYRVSEIRQIRRAIDKAGRPMVLSLSPGPTAPEHAAEIGSMANLWRISNDVWDYWQSPPNQTGGFPQSFLGQMPLLATWAPDAKPGNWPDADMLPLGELKPSPGYGQPRASRLTPAEQRSMMTLWAVARSPLILGANLTLLDTPTLDLLTNRDVLRVNQTATRSAEVYRQGKFVGWRADLPGGEKAIALFNLGDTEATPTVPLAMFGADLANRGWSVREVWAGGAAVSGNQFLERIPAHGAVLLMLQ